MLKGIDRYMLQVTSTYGGYKDCERSYLLQAIDTFHSLYQDQVEEETHSGHLSTQTTTTTTISIRSSFP